MLEALPERSCHVARVVAESPIRMRIVKLPGEAREGLIALSAPSADIGAAQRFFWRAVYRDTLN